MPELAGVALALLLAAQPSRGPEPQPPLRQRPLQQPAPQDTAASACVQPPIRLEDAWFGSDKVRHFGLSFAATTFAFAGARTAGMRRDAALAVAIPAAAVAGVGKEIHDRRRGGIFSVRDIVADALGVTAAYFLLREVR